MRPFSTSIIAVSLFLGLILAWGEFPHPASALKPLDDEMLTALSPATVAKEPERIPLKKQRMIERQVFENSICFKRCHQPGDFSASDKTARQWRLLIEKNGHAIFSAIPWKNDLQKKQALDFLIKNAYRGYEVGSEGIGFWK